MILHQVPAWLSNSTVNVLQIVLNLLLLFKITSFAEFKLFQTKLMNKVNEYHKFLDKTTNQTYNLRFLKHKEY